MVKINRIGTTECAQKASSFIPTVLFGIPGAPFAAILMGLFLYIGIDLGSPDTFYDKKLFDSMAFAFLLGTIITAIICYALAYFAGWVTKVPYVYYFPFIIATILRKLGEAKLEVEVSYLGITYNIQAPNYVLGL